MIKELGSFTWKQARKTAQGKLLMLRSMFHFRSWLILLLARKDIKVIVNVRVYGEIDVDGSWLVAYNELYSDSKKHGFTIESKEKEQPE